MSEQALFDENLTAEFGLEHIIRTRLMGIDPDEQDVRLDDADWQAIIDLIAALKSVPALASELHAKWDEGMRAGKLLIALMDPHLNYRADITAIHEAIAKVGPKP